MSLSSREDKRRAISLFRDCSTRTLSSSNMNVKPWTLRKLARQKPHRCTELIKAPRILSNQFNKTFPKEVLKISAAKWIRWSKTSYQTLMILWMKITSSIKEMVEPITASLVDLTSTTITSYLVIIETRFLLLTKHKMTHFLHLR